MQSFVDRFRYKATKARQAQSRVKQIEKLEIPEIRRSSRIAPKLQFRQERPSGRLVLKVEGLNKQFNQTPVLQDISFQVERGEKVALIGPNGIGKSTLLKIALEQLVPDSGAYEWGYEANISYFAQDHHEQLRGSVSAYDWLYQFASHETVSFIRGLLGRVLLSGDEGLKPVSALSGGEAARLLFAKIMLENRNVLVLDEPTNHLDLEGVEVLADALNAYPGTVIVVSHDRYFIAEIATHILELTPEGARDYPGTYQEYLNHFGDDHLSTESGKLRNRKQTAQTTSKHSHEQRKDLKRNHAKLPTETERLETRISHAERKLAELNQLFSSGGFYTENPSAEIEQLQRKHQQLEQELSKSLDSWETSSKQLETLRTQLNNAA
jgi:ABC-type multidrug transport system ATPase subunit